VRTEVVSTGLDPNEQDESCAIYTGVKAETNSAESFQCLSEHGLRKYTGFTDGSTYLSFSAMSTTIR
jgi:hypothetical protein